jgi:uncharacterized membrane protein YebE (DUF533 family)
MSHANNRKQTMEIKIMKLLKSTIIALMLTAPLAAIAQSTATPKFDQRQANQERRIDQGAQSGALTPKETGRLEKGQDHLQSMEDKAKSDGQVTKQERAKLQHAENRQSERIYRQKHDRQHDYNHNGQVDRPRHASR